MMSYPLAAASEVSAPVSGERPRELLREETSRSWTPRRSRVAPVSSSVRGEVSVLGQGVPRWGRLQRLEHRPQHLGGGADRAHRRRGSGLIAIRGVQYAQPPHRRPVEASEPTRSIPGCAPDPPRLTWDHPVAFGPEDVVAGPRWARPLPPHCEEHQMSTSNPDLPAESVTVDRCRDVLRAGISQLWMKANLHELRPDAG